MNVKPEEYREKLRGFSNATLQKIFHSYSTKNISPPEMAKIVVESKSEKEFLKTLDNL